MRLSTLRPLFLALLAIGVASAVVSGPDRVQAASSAVTVSVTVLSQTTFSATGCPTGLGVTGFGPIPAGVTSITPSDCTFSFGSNNATSSLRMYQQDGADDAMWRSSDGTLDTSFDGDAAMPGYPGNGVVRSNTYGDSFAAATQPDGKIVVAGAEYGADPRFMVARYNPNGTLDTSFDGDAAMPGYPGNGIVTTNVRAVALVEQAQAIVIQGDGKILVAGTAGAVDMALVRYNPDGTLDTSFDGDAAMPGFPGNGIVERDVAGEGYDQAHALAVRADGRIVVGGTGMISGGEHITVLQLMADGSWDTSFDGDAAMPLYPGNGRVSTLIAANDRGYALVLQPDGKVVIGGVIHDGPQRNFVLVRYAADGTLDTTFDGSASMPGYPGNGKVTTAYGSTQDNAFNGLALQPDGKLVQGGTLVGGASDAVVLARYNTDGSLDTGFDGDTTMPGYPGNGVVRTTTPPGTLWTTHDVMITPDSRIVTVADLDDPSDGAVTLVYRADGTLDTSFSSDGMDSIGPAAGDDTARAVTLGIDGRIITAGHHNGTNIMLLTYDTIRVPDWNSGVNDWTTTAFGTCLSSTTGGLGWTPTLNCPAGTPSAWHAVPDSSASSGNVVATSPFGVSNTTASLRFGFRPSATQESGAYVAPIVVEVIAS
ncbi:MAG: hypothetical protein JWM90_1570 [Thermoleophilia bacterium]|nr:hypothetical protein [Thermoleophilia bacterium]